MESYDIFQRCEKLGYQIFDLKTPDELIDNLKKQIGLLNGEELIDKTGIDILSDREFDRVLIRLLGKTVYESAKILRNQWILDLDNSKTAYISFLSDNVAENTYQIAPFLDAEFFHESTILVNGLPIVELIYQPDMEINQIINRLNHRRKKYQGIYRFVQIFVVSTGHETKYFANCNEYTSSHQKQSFQKRLAFYWTDENNIRINQLNAFISDFLTKSNITELITKYFIIKDTEPVLLVMRPYQIYAVKRAFDRIIMANTNGYVFHTTGSGKTLTSYKLASLLRDDRRIDKVFFLIDRKDLDDQTVDEYNSFEAGCVDQTDNTRQLVESLKDSSKTLIITTIQKMSNAIKNADYTDVLDSLKNHRCVFIIDECHRTQFGIMHAQIRRYFNNANYIGFTGTPIFKENLGQQKRTTADLFKAGQLDACIHRYMIKEAIDDGNVLGFSVEHYDVNPDETKRIEIISDFIQEHLEHQIKIGKDRYTAIFTVESIPVLMRYYRYLKNHNPKQYRIAAIFSESFDSEDKADYSMISECMSDYNKMFGTHFDNASFDAYRRDVSNRMKQKKLPQIDLLLVVNMLIAGFDSVATNTLYIDRSLQYHHLIQAYSRTNRVGNPTKVFGKIVSFRDNREEQDSAFKLFSDGEKESFLAKGYEEYLADYSKQVLELKYVAPTPENAEIFEHSEDLVAFVKYFRKLSKTLLMLKTFNEFSWNDLSAVLDQTTYMDYKTLYLNYYDSLNKNLENRSPVFTPIDDIDFDIELIRTDSINMDYIMKLLENVDFHSNVKSKQDYINEIEQDINRSDNEIVMNKKDILKDFMADRFDELDSDADIKSDYQAYEDDRKRQMIDDFAKKHDVEQSFIISLLDEYQHNPISVSKEKLRKQVMDLHLGLIKMSQLVYDLEIFLYDMSAMFGSEN
ncbi:MAG: type I restriction endonuclease subunit R [Erysipelotrichaceae bacterium]|nr:type I restriction endonuclease subunit R [Erysipelotrichaceae bacterium]